MSDIRCSFCERPLDEHRDEVFRCECGNTVCDNCWRGDKCIQCQECDRELDDWMNLWAGDQ
jgi:hypothetical protein